jgi:hypothetical protein
MQVFADIDVRTPIGERAVGACKSLVNDDRNYMLTVKRILIPKGKAACAPETPSKDCIT